MSHLAITDLNGFYGSARAHQKAKELGIQAIVGAEITLPDGSQLPLIVRNRSGYQNLSRLLTRAHLSAPKGQARVSWELLSTYSSGLTALSGDSLGPIHRALDHSPDKLPELMEQLLSIFGQDQLYLQLHRHHIPAEDQRQQQIIHLFSILEP
jgi:error-prone DNA polymerase